MTVIAGDAACDMRRVLAGSDDTVMAGAAGPDHLAVIDSHHGHENVGAVAIFTDIGRLNVCQVLARCIRAVMAANAVAGNIYVVEICR